MPYGYCQIVRFLGMLGFGYLVYKEYELGNKNWMIFCVISAILINPIFKISLGRELWSMVDVIWAIILIGILIVTKNEKKSAENNLYTIMLLKRSRYASLSTWHLFKRHNT